MTHISLPHTRRLSLFTPSLRTAHLETTCDEAPSHCPFLIDLGALHDVVLTSSGADCGAPGRQVRGSFHLCWPASLYRVINELYDT